MSVNVSMFLFIKTRDLTLNHIWILSLYLTEFMIHAIRIVWRLFYHFNNKGVLAIQNMHIKQNAIKIMGRLLYC